MLHSIISIAQAPLKRLGLYHRLKASFVYTTFWSIVKPSTIKKTNEELEFYRKTLKGLSKDDLVFDIGANHGHKTTLFLRLVSRVVSVDPDPSNAEILRQKFHFLRFNKKAVTIVAKAVGESTGTQKMWMEKPGSAKNTLSQKWVETLQTDSSRFGENIVFNSSREVEITTLEQLIEVHGRPFFVKIDVEGYEPNVISGLRSAVPYLSFEVNLPEFLPEAIKCVDMLDQLCPKSRFNFVVDCVDGLALPEWQAKDAFLNEMKACKAPSIEVFWTTV